VLSAQGVETSGGGGLESVRFRPPTADFFREIKSHTKCFRGFLISFGIHTPQLAAGSFIDKLLSVNYCTERRKYLMPEFRMTNIAISNQKGKKVGWGKPLLRST
jgi:hypothetical protein